MEGGGLPNTDLIAQGIPPYPPMGEPTQPRRESGASSGEARDLTPDLTMKNPGQIYSNSSQRAWTSRKTAYRRRVRVQTSLETVNGGRVRARTSRETADGSGAARKWPVYQEREREEKSERGKTEDELPRTIITGEQENQKEDSQMKSPETKESMETQKREAKKEKEIQGDKREESTARETREETIVGKEKEDKRYCIPVQRTVRSFEKQRRALELHRKKRELEREQTQEELEMQKKEENLQRKIQEEWEHQRSEVALKEEQVKEDFKRQKIENAKLDIHGVQLELQRDRRKEEHYEQEREEEMHMMRIEEELERQKREEVLEEQKHQEELEKMKKEMEHMEQELARKKMEWQRQSEIQEHRLAMQKRQLELARQEREEKQKREEEYRRQKLEEEAAQRKKEEEELHRQQIKEREENEIKELEKQKIERQLQKQKLQQQLEDQKREREKQREKREEQRELQRRKRDMERQKREKELTMQKKEKEIGANFEKVIQDFMQFEGNVPVKSMSLRDHVKSLKEVADAVDQDNRVANYAGVTGATLSVAGGIITLSGAALAPFTGGASLVASVGVGGAFAGGLTRVLGSVKEKLDQKKNEKRVDEILNSCLQTLEGMESDYIQVWTEMEELEKKMRELEMEQLKLKYRGLLQYLKRRLSMFEPALKAEMFKVVLRSITHLTARILSRVMVEKVSQEVSHVAATEIAKQVAQEMSKRSTSYWSYEAIKEFLTFSSREVSKKWYVDMARTSAVASGVAAAVFLPFDVKDLRQEATNLTKGAKSEMAEEIRHVADLLLKLTCTFEERI